MFTGFCLMFLELCKILLLNCLLCCPLCLLMPFFLVFVYLCVYVFDVHNKAFRGPICRKSTSQTTPIVQINHTLFSNFCSHVRLFFNHFARPTNTHTTNAHPPTDEHMTIDALGAIGHSQDQTTTAARTATIGTAPGRSTISRGGVQF